MKRCFTFEWAETDGADKAHVHFVPPGFDDISAIVEEFLVVRRDLAQPGKVIFLGFEFAANTIKELLASAELEARRGEIQGTGDAVFEIWLFRADGSLWSQHSGQPVAFGAADKLRTAGMLVISTRRAVVYETPPSFHYVKPSGHHINRFVRAADALVCGAEVTFIAAWLLRHLPSELRIVHCDTSGIAALAHTALNLRALYDGYPQAVAVDSFGSYAGLKGNTLADRSGCFVLISASTSGSMARQIIESGVDFARVITVYYLGKTKPEQKVLCDLTNMRTPGGVPPAINQTEADCPLCAKGSIPLSMEGDEFMPEPPKFTYCMVQEAHLPKWLHGFLGKAVGRPAIRCAVARGSGDVTDEIFLSAHQYLLGDADLRQQWALLLSRSIPADLARIIYFEDDDASKALALNAREFAIARGIAAPPLLAFKRGVRLAPAELSGKGATLVVVSALVKGRRIASVGRELRAAPGPIVYLVGISRTESAEIHRRVRSNLTKTNSGVEHVFHATVEINLPPARRDTASSWASERRFLERWSNQEKLLVVFQTRLDLLTVGREGGEIGLRADLFLPKPQGDKLCLRNNSILFPASCQAKDVVQADVFVAISAILHQLRAAEPGKDSLGRGLRHHALIAPGNFERFTDGIIQAALLRAALPVELDFSKDAQASGEMREILASIFRGHADDQGEAALEFALAIATRRLQLAPAEMELLLRQWNEEQNAYSETLRSLVTHTTATYQRDESGT